LSKCTLYQAFFIVGILFVVLILIHHYTKQISAPLFAAKLGNNVSQSLRLQLKSIDQKQGMLEVWEKMDDHWSRMFSPIEVSLGTNGLIAAVNKKEGDGCTPEGIYALKRAFGYNPIVTKMNYTQLTEDDYWVDDPTSPVYNQFVTQLPVSGSYEKMKRTDDLYKLGIVIEYNTEPVVSGKGSAIFMHVWRGPGSLTAGCVAMKEEDLKKLLEWLDPDKNPVIILNK
jgi:L,D-peptidoglycan transpeptidase YkuD (ErfK/YbiS/YcfS/YnhG family)